MSTIPTPPSKVAIDGDIPITDTIDERNSDGRNTLTSDILARAENDWAALIDAERDLTGDGIPLIASLAVRAAAADAGCAVPADVLSEAIRTLTERCWIARERFLHARIRADMDAHGEVFERAQNHV